MPQISIQRLAPLNPGLPYHPPWHFYNPAIRPTRPNTGENPPNARRVHDQDFPDSYTPTIKK